MQRMPFDVVLMSSCSKQRLAIVRLRTLVDTLRLILMTAHLIKAPKVGNGVRQHRQTVQWDDIAGLGTISALFC